MVLQGKCGVVQAGAAAEGGKNQAEKHLHSNHKQRQQTSTSSTSPALLALTELAATSRPPWTASSLRAPRTIRHVDVKGQP